ncbi:MAG: PilZ domain-containing protein [Actinomycetota bacterium]|jgi:hypothetical protein|nr:PilZ domain-containing protein [Actinomycetota bacterium]
MARTIEVIRLEGHELGALVGRWARLRPTDGAGVVVGRERRSGGIVAVSDGVLAGRSSSTGLNTAHTGSGARSPWVGGDWVEVAVVSNLDNVLRCETRDPRAVALAGRPVLVELGATEAMVRLPGMVRVLIDRPLPIVLAVTARGELEYLQRREWVRARVTVPVEIVVDATHGGRAFRSTTVDLSGGGARIKLAGPVEEGEAVRLTLWLPTGPLEVDCNVLEVIEESTARLVFDNVPEAVCKRLVRFVFDVQVRNHRLAES